VTIDRIVVVTRKTRLDELVERFNTRGQARFYITHAGGDFADYEREHEAYQQARDRLTRELDVGLPRQVLDRSLVPTYTFSGRDLIVTLGQDGLVANVAKYAAAQPIVGINPDPERFDGILLPFQTGQARAAVGATLDGSARVTRVTLAEIELADGQRLLAFNDLFIGTRTHASARYRIAVGGVEEGQSSSGVLISTGVGSTGWMSSVFNMAAGVAAFAGGGRVTPIRFAWDDPRLMFAVREPFASRHSSASIVAGYIERGRDVTLHSQMPSGGVIFSDGMEADYLEFNAGAVGRVRAAHQQAVLVVEA
jgi:NAD kinase